MGVHDLDVYPEVKKLLGIPEDEPIFILRAQDALASETVFDYKKRCERYGTHHVASEFVAGVGRVIHSFDVWAKENHKKVKYPD